ncbi:MAG TPA: FKBP-type peptidyl-prolyl cis-trans isomerase [Longimicrobium sp.]|nr:FKBP-type peptidyl-prolyl cis-trans isomerase [Longimicrobium sp.]
MRIPRLIFAAAALVTFAAACDNGLDIEPIIPECARPAPPASTTKGDTVVYANGLRYLDTQAGVGDTALLCIVTNAGDGNDTIYPAVAIHYEVFLENGTKVESSVDAGQPISFELGQGLVIQGLDQGILGMRTGGRRRLIIPPALAYGAEGRRNDKGEFIIPPNSTLIIDVRLINFDGF